MAEIKHVTIIGVGLIGGSIGKVLRKDAVRVSGVGRRESSLKAALKVGAIDDAHLDCSEPVATSDLVILATPVGTFEKYFRQIKPLLKRGAIVTDVGSTKGEVVRSARKVWGSGKDNPFIGSHPMAGNENKGPQHATITLLKDALCIITPLAKTPKAKVQRVVNFWKNLGMQTAQMTPAAHDLSAARVSHLPHLISAAMMMLPADGDLEVAATGFRDMTRLAGGDPEMWRDIVATNRKPIIKAIDELLKAGTKLRTLIDTGNEKAVEKFLAKAKTRRDTKIS
ncbi:MAG: prephenate dehydrogenase [Phycisphaerae bacterium]|nr:prephenate dehydrogenase [Phycisphaerae bacterium]